MKTRNFKLFRNNWTWLDRKGVRQSGVINLRHRVMPIGDRWCHHLMTEIQTGVACLYHTHWTFHLENCCQNRFEIGTCSSTSKRFLKKWYNSDPVFSQDNLTENVVPCKRYDENNAYRPLKQTLILYNRETINCLWWPAQNNCGW